MSNKERGDNFSQLQTNFLIKYVKSRKNVMENKKTGSSMDKLELKN
uniref:Regulatory protein zeste n=1 Tax=Romanomermis culicivorax TaxID=13658 RepID=A0A915HS25_ROMCU